MERFLVRKSAPQSEVQHLVNHLKVFPLKKKSIAKRGAYKNKPRSDWDTDQRGAAAEVSVADGSPLHCEWHLCLSYTHVNISGSAREIYRSEIYHTKSTGLREISHSKIYHREFDLARTPPPF